MMQLDFYDIPLTDIPDVCYGYILRHQSGDIKVGVTSRPIQRFSSYMTHADTGLMLVHLEAFPSSAWAKAWEKNVMFHAMADKETFIPRSNRWQVYVLSGRGESLSIDISTAAKKKGPMIDVKRRCDLNLMRCLKWYPTRNLEHAPL